MWGATIKRWNEQAEKYERAFKSGKITKQQYEDFHLMKKSLQLANTHPFLEACGQLMGTTDFRQKTPGCTPCNPRLHSKKYLLRFQELAMNELLGRPTARESTLRPIINDASKGNFEELDRILGFVDSDGKEIQLPSQSDIDEMLDEMDNVLWEI